jgi:hypothetical protein
MDSSSEAFEKLWMWKKSKTWLRVTVVTKDGTTSAKARICGADSSASQVVIAGEQVHSFSAFDMDGAEFSVESKRVVATRNEFDWIVFEELPD